MKKLVLSLVIAVSTMSFLESNSVAASGKYKDWDPLQIEQELTQLKTQLEELKKHPNSLKSVQAQMEQKLKELEQLKKKI